MTSPRKRDKLKAWILGFLSLEDDIRHTPDGPLRRGASGGFISHAQGFTVHNPTVMSVHGNQYTTTYVQGDRNIVPQIMNLLSQHIIRGAAHDSSARSPPPRCHPDTRVKLIARITAWFEGQGSQELLLWITGPAGVGKSAIVQTFAEYLAKSQRLGASVFISRPNKRNNPDGIFITIAYQLAVRIEAYRNFIVERLSLDPELLSGDMQAQFNIFIIEPFVEKKIGAGGRRWGVLLDGLDELDGEDAQCCIVQLISTFVHEHRDAPLVWIIASRPESHISNTFDDNEVHRSYWSEYIPIDSTEACNDVENFLRSRFKTIRKKFRQTVPRDWPSNGDFLKLAAASSGLFVYAEVVMRFIGDPHHTDPASRLKVLLSVIDRSNTVPTSDNPFFHLDALYKEILSSIPLTQWPIAKQLLAFTIHAEHTFLSSLARSFGTLRGMSILFGIHRHVIYACLDKCRSTLKIPDWKNAHKQRLTFLHASFADYLSDSTRSGDFHVGDVEDLIADMDPRVMETWNLCSGDCIATVSVEHMWQQYCSKLDDKSPSKAVAKFHDGLFTGMVQYTQKLIVYRLNLLLDPMLVRSFPRAQLCKVYMIKLCYYLSALALEELACNLVANLSGNQDLELRGLGLGSLDLGHLDWKEMSPARVHYGRTGKISLEKSWLLHRPRSSAELEAFVSELESLQERSPQLEVGIIGAIPGQRVAAFRVPMEEFHGHEEEGFTYYVIPFAE